MPKGIYRRTKKHQINWFKKGHKPTKGMLGKHHAEESRKKIRFASLGRRFSLETRQKLSRAQKGKKRSKETKRKISEAQKGRKLSEETKRKMSIAHGGTGISIRTNKRYYHLLDYRYKKWRSRVFERDNWTCQTCGKRGCYLEPHHIKSWSKYPRLRYRVENGATLCLECHKLTRN